MRQAPANLDGIVHIIDKVGSARRVLKGALGLPDGHATKALVVLVLAEQVLRVVVRQVALPGRLLVAGQADKQQRLLALGRGAEVRDPVVVVEVGVGGLAARVVVELDEEGVEGSVADDALHLEPLVAQGALGRGRDEDARVVGADLLDHEAPRLGIICEKKLDIGGACAFGTNCGVAGFTHRTCARDQSQSHRRSRCAR